MKYVITGQSADDNFGLPSLINGCCSLVRSLDPTAEFVYYENKELSEITKQSLARYEVVCKKVSAGKGAILDAILVRLGFKKSSKYDFVNEIRQANMVIDCYGIYFCDRFKKKYRGYFRTIKSACGIFGVNIIAKLLSVKSIKFPASYGPITQKTDKVVARFSSRYAFHKMYAREKQSMDELVKLVPTKKVSYSPDVANLVEYETKKKDKVTIGIAASSQITRKWSAEDSYQECVISLIKHIRETIREAEVTLFPNEIHRQNSYNDMHLAKEIKESFKDDDAVVIFDSENRTFYDQKNSIASCDLVVSSRYHACVAALSAGVPVLTVGWHYKYSELTELYGQSKWILNDSHCSPTTLCDEFDELWNIRDIEREALSQKANEVREITRDEFRSVFEQHK